MNAILALEDGTYFSGESVGAPGTCEGEVVFNTAMTGYQEVFTDPSYCGQIVVMTFPLMGNYGVNQEDGESFRPRLAGVAVKELPPRPSNYRASGTLPEFLSQERIVGIQGIDTRALVRYIRSQGAMRGILSTEVDNPRELVRRAARGLTMQGLNLVKEVSRGEVTTWEQGLGAPASKAATARGSRLHILAIDCGIKHNMLRQLVASDCRVTVAPASISAGRVRELSPDGILVGNGPGDPAAVPDTVNTLRELMGTIPIFGICLGHQMLALALGAQTYKLRFGHHGANVPVLNRPADRVEITSQNHGFAVDAASLERAGGTVTHVNLNDDSLEGFLHEDRQLMAVQFHPEAAPGPHDSNYLFARFVQAVQTRQPLSKDILILEGGDPKYWSATHE